MDFVDGERLYQWRRKTVPSLRSICEVFIKTSLALHELHRHGIFHRDIKSDNLVVRPDGEPVLLDMGIARSGANYIRAAAGYDGLFLTVVRILPRPAGALIGFLRER
jgi:serine/threonine-protein kinase